MGHGSTPNFAANATYPRRAPIDPAELERLRGKATAAVARVLPTITGDGTELYTHEMIRALRAAWAQRSTDGDPEPDEEDR